eukprot:6181063-Pleurochrysis_carterae.AAC.1
MAIRANEDPPTNIKLPDLLSIIHRYVEDMPINTARTVLEELKGKENLPDERRLQLLQAVAAAAAHKAFHVKLLYATPRELRTMIIQQVRLKANGLAHAEAQATQKPFVAPKLSNQNILAAIDDIAEKVRNAFYDLCSINPPLIHTSAWNLA